MKLSQTLAALMATAAFASAAVAQTDLRITHPMSGNKAAFDAIVAEFEAANPDITVNADRVRRRPVFRHRPDHPAEEQRGARHLLPVGRASRCSAMSRRAYAYDLTDAMARWLEGHVSPSAFAPGAGTVVDGTPYMVPISLDITNTIWYNKTIFEENGLTPPATWDEFVGGRQDAGRGGRDADRRSATTSSGRWATGPSHVASRVVPAAEYDGGLPPGRQPFTTPGFEKALELMEELQRPAAFNRTCRGWAPTPRWRPSSRRRRRCTRSGPGWSPRNGQSGRRRTLTTRSSTRR